VGYCARERERKKNLSVFKRKHLKFTLEIQTVQNLHILRKIGMNKRYIQVTYKQISYFPLAFLQPYRKIDILVRQNIRQCFSRN
jgi:hypothetical protein